MTSKIDKALDLQSQAIVVLNGECHVLRRALMLASLELVNHQTAAGTKPLSTSAVFDHFMASATFAQQHYERDQAVAEAAKRQAEAVDSHWDAAQWCEAGAVQMTPLDSIDRVPPVGKSLIREGDAKEFFAPIVDGVSPATVRARRASTGQLLECNTCSRTTAPTMTEKVGAICNAKSREGMPCDGLLFPLRTARGKAMFECDRCGAEKRDTTSGASCWGGNQQADCGGKMWPQYEKPAAQDAEKG